MKYLCFAVAFLYASVLHSAMAGEGFCVTQEQMLEMMQIATKMLEDGKIDEVCKEFLITEADPDTFQEKMEEYVVKVKGMEEPKKTEVKDCLRETLVMIREEMENKISDECFQEMMENCQLQKA